MILISDLEELDLSNNQIVNFPDDIFEVLQNLKILRLKQNLLADLDRELFSDLVKLEVSTRADHEFTIHLRA